MPGSSCWGQATPLPSRILAIALTVGGAGGLVAAGLPFAVGLSSLRFRRIWALTKLTFKEAIRNRVLYGFSALLLVFLFGSWFIPHKPEDQVRSYVGVVYWVMKILLLLAAVILAAFSIPNDIQHQTIHTIITKPVERFEILLGRFLGFTALMTLVLLLMASVSVVYVLRGIDPEAAAESLKAREPLYGMLHFENTGDAQKGTNVGREWDYRSYITAASPNSRAAGRLLGFPQRAKFPGRSQHGVAASSPSIFSAQPRALRIAASPAPSSSIRATSAKAIRTTTTSIAAAG